MLDLFKFRHSCTAPFRLCDLFFLFPHHIFLIKLPPTQHSSSLRSSLPDAISLYFTSTVKHQQLIFKKPFIMNGT